MKNKYKGLAEYLVKKDQYLALNLEQARYIVKLIKAFEKKKVKARLKEVNKIVDSMNLNEHLRDIAYSHIINKGVKK